MKMMGRDIIDRIVGRIIDKGDRPYDSVIVRYLRELDHKQTLELFTLGDVSQWRNEKIQNDESA